MTSAIEHAPPGTVAIPEITASLQRSPHPQIDVAVTDVAARKDAWAATDVESRIALLDRMIRDTQTTARRWVQVECDRKHIPSDRAIAGEEWFGGPSFVVRNLRLLRETLRGLARDGQPHLPGPVRISPNGRVLARVFPTNGYDRVVFAGFTADVWMPPGVGVDEVLATTGGVYRSHGHRVGRVGVVLGAGNISSIAVTDVLCKMFGEDQVVVLKLSPLTAPLGPVIADALRAVVDGGFLRIVYGGGAEGEHLIHHPLVDAVHLTGSDKTHDAIVFGAGPEGARRKAAGEPLMTKPVTSELGNVTPMIVVPGRWASRDIDYQAEHIVTTLAHNGGFNCISTRVLVMHRGWDQRDALLAAVRRLLRGLPNRYAYYPGAQERFTSFVEEHREAEQIGAGAPGSLPWAFLGGVDGSDASDVCTVDPFAPAFSEVVLDGGSPADFLNRAVDFCNERLWGTLGASVIVQPNTSGGGDLRPALRRAERDLRYGCVVFNHWSAAAFALLSPPWGAFPGASLADIQSGRGFVHNTYLLSRPEKTVMHAPFRSRPRPPWFVTHGRQRDALAANVDLEATQDPRVLARMAYFALRG